VLSVDSRAPKFYYYEKAKNIKSLPVAVTVVAGKVETRSGTTLKAATTAVPVLENRYAAK